MKETYLGPACIWKVCGNEHLLNTRHKLETYKSNMIDNLQRKHILLASKAKHSSTPQVKIRGYIKAKSYRLFEKLHIVSLKSAKLLYIVSDRCIVILYCMFLFMVALCNRESGRPYIFSSCFFFFLFFSSPNLSSRRLDVYHTLAHGVVLV